MSSRVTTLLGAAGPPADNLLTQRKSLPEPVQRLRRRTLHTLGHSGSHLDRLGRVRAVRPHPRGWAYPAADSQNVLSGDRVPHQRPRSGRSDDVGRDLLASASDRLSNSLVRSSSRLHHYNNDDIHRAIGTPLCRAQRRPKLVDGPSAPLAHRGSTCPSSPGVLVTVFQMASAQRRCPSSFGWNQSAA